MIRGTAMLQDMFRFRRLLGFALALLVMAMSGLMPSPVAAQSEVALTIKQVAAKKLAQLPGGVLYWRIENFPTLAQARAAEGPTSLAAEVLGKVWLFTLGAEGATTPGGSKVAEIGPVPPITAPEYLLRINNAYGPPGAKTPVHTHPGPSFFYVLAGRLGQKTPHGVRYADAGQSIPGHGRDIGQVSSIGPGNLNALGLFVVDATKPFRSAARFE
jgi:hypothetical protein